jgi:hypothetical protein
MNIQHKNKSMNEQNETIPCVSTDTGMDDIDRIVRAEMERLAAWEARVSLIERIISDREEE